MQYNDLNKHFFNDFDRFILIANFQEKTYDREIARLQNRMNAISFTIKKTIENSHSIKLIKSQLRYNYIIIEQINRIYECNEHELHLMQLSNFRIVAMKAILQQLIMKKTTIEKIVHFRSNSRRMMNVSINNKQRTKNIVTTSFLRRILQTFASNVVANRFRRLNNKIHDMNESHSNFRNKNQFEK